MPDDLFQFIPGPNRRSLRIVFRGFWDERAMQSYVEALRQRAIAAGGASPINRVLMDLRECNVQSQPVLDGFAQIILNYANQISHYGYLLPESTLLKLQLKRLTLPSSTRFFDDEGEALQWLAS